MELIYLYIEEFRDIIKNWEITFSPEYKITKTDNYIEVEKLENESLEGFFGRNILNVNAIVGPNGSGKTVLCECMYSYAFGNMYSSTIFILKDGEGLKLYYNSYLGDIKWSESHSTPIPFSAYGDNFNLGLIYFSSAMNGREFYSWSKGYKINISNSYIMASALSNDFFTNGDSDYAKYRRSDLVKQIDLLDSVDLSLGFTIENVGFFYIKSVSDQDTTKFNSSQLGQYIYNKVLLLDSSSKKNRRIRIEDEELCLLILFWAELWALKAHEEYSNLLEKMLDCSNMEELNRLIMTFNLDESVEALISYYHFLKIHIKEFSNLLLTILGVSGAVELLFQMQFDLPRIRVKEFMNKYHKTGSMDYLDVSWHLSAGQNAALCLFARLWHLRSSHSLGEGFILLLDEADTFLHPEWAKNWNNELFKFLEAHFSSYKIHVIFTTHSPFTLSDIPDTNVIYLGEGATELEQKKTFAENINVLLSDSFYVKGAFIGEFAKKKVQELVHYLETGRCDDPYINSRERALQVVEMIGEPVISWHLQELLSKKGDL